MMNKELFEIGLQIRREVLGAEYVDKSISQELFGQGQVSVARCGV
jgi:hypothetical protein